MNYCPNCGNILQIQSKFCSACGIPLSKFGDETRPDFQRARTMEQIAQRQAEIINACDVLFTEGGYDAVNFTAISDMTSIARQAIYKYYSSKEEVLMDLLKREIGIWRDDLFRQLDDHDTMTKEQYCEFLAASWADHEKMLSLQSLLRNVLEGNCSVEKLADFKTDIVDYLSTIGRTINKYFPDVPQDKIEIISSGILAFVVGMYSLNNLSAKHLEAGERAGYTQFDQRQSFAEMCLQFLKLIVSTF